MFKKANRRKLFDLALILIIVLLVIKLVSNIEILAFSLSRLASFITKVLGIFIIGFAIAYVLNSMVEFIMKCFKCNRLIAITITYVLTISFVALCVFAIIPPMISNSKTIINNLPTYINNSQSYINDLTDNLPEEIRIPVIEFAEEFLRSLSDSLQSLLKIDILSGIVGGATTVLLNIIMGIILSIYMLYNKQRFQSGAKTSIMAAVGAEKSIKIYSIASKINLIFKNFIVGKALLSVIVFVLSLIGFSILRVPYAFLCAAFIGITNMIPYFGSIIGAIPTLLIVLIVDMSLWKVLWALLFIIAVQQVEALVISPRILGTQLGIDSLLILAGVIIGQQVFGTIGLFIGVPIVAAIKLLIYDEYVKPLALKRERANLQDPPFDDKK